MPPPQYNEYGRLISDGGFLLDTDPYGGDYFPGQTKNHGPGDVVSDVGGQTSSNIVPSLSIYPSENQSIVVGTTLCITASGVLAFPQEAEQLTILDGGCSANNVPGFWGKNCGINGEYDGEAFDTKLIHKKRPWQFTGRNSSLNSPSTAPVNIQLLLGVKSTGGYYFYWHVGKHCNSLSNCNDVWTGAIRMVSPDGTQTSFRTGYFEYRQLFRVRSDGNAIVWDCTTENKWANNIWGVPIPADAGDFQFFTNAAYFNNTWTELKGFKGSYQASFGAEDFNWTSSCNDDLVVTGNKACFTPTTTSHCQICVSTINSDPKCVSVVASPLSLKPAGIECKSCGTENIDCANIPNPSLPVVTLVKTGNSVAISWTSSTSLTYGLYYEISINGTIQSALDTDVTINSLPTGAHVIRVRALDACGESAWSASQTVNI